MSVLGGMTLQYSKEKSLLNSPVGKEVAGIKWARCSWHGVVGTVSGTHCAGGPR